MSSSTPNPPRRRPTIADVARRAGVSAAAVSFAVNDRPGVSSGTRERILAAARELGWRPSASARALTEARTRAIGLVLARDVGATRGRLVLRALPVRDRARADRRPTTRCCCRSCPARRRAALPAYERLAAAGRVDGFLLTDVEADDPRFALLEAAGVPVVLAGRPAGRCPFPWVETRHDEGMAPGGRAPGRARARADRVPRRRARTPSTCRRARRRWRAALASAGLRPGRSGTSPATRARRRCALLRRGADRDRLLERRARAGVVRRGAGARAARARTTSPSSASTTRRWRRFATPGADVGAGRLRGVRRGGRGRAAGRDRRRAGAGLLAVGAGAGGARLDRAAPRR